jgi:hypothetical protein
MIWDKAIILETETNIRYRKYKELAHMACLTNPISQPSLDSSPILTPLICSEVTIHKYQYDATDFYNVLFLGVQLLLLRWR